VQDVKDQRVVRVGRHTDAAEQHGIDVLESDHVGRGDHVHRVRHDQRVLAGVRDVVVKMVNDGCFLLVELHAALVAQVPNSVPDV
jgi:hypothetical protein